VYPHVTSVSPVSSAIDHSTVLKSEAARRFVEAAGNFCRQLGLPRSLGQIYGLVFLSPRPLSLDEITALLQISKASASTGSRQLASWGAIRQVWVPGDRRDYFEAVTDIASVVRQIYSDFLKPRLAASGDRLTRMANTLDTELGEGLLTVEEHRHLASRLGMVSRLRQKAEFAGPVVERLI
jgi:DNA-binding transcriptional regulator GbsR (MarR family)